MPVTLSYTARGRRCLVEPGASGDGDLSRLTRSQRRRWGRERHKVRGGGDPLPAPGVLSCESSWSHPFPRFFVTEAPRRLFRGKTGFTLVELLVVTAIIGILIALP
ncbi:MAG: type IV pilin protein [Thermoguttaceae bacterium]